MAQPTPMMQHYIDTKKEYNDCILFYRLGDFYEMFFDDAKTVSRELELTLTGKSCGLEERAPMCGIPYHAAQSYITRLVNKGYKVAICEQMEDPRFAKGIVKREVIRIVTPGTNISAADADSAKNNFLMGIANKKGTYGVSSADISTGDYYVTELKGIKKVIDEINKFMPLEILVCDEELEKEPDFIEVTEKNNILVSRLDKWYGEYDNCEKLLKEHFKTFSLEGQGLSDYYSGICASGMVLQYLYETQKVALEHLTSITSYNTGEFMVLDSATRRNLELTETIREKQKKGSLLWVLDKTKTSMGARMLRSFIEQPLIDVGAINERLNIVESFKENAVLREEIREYLSTVYDLERLIGRICYHSATPRDLISFKQSLSMLPSIKLLMTDLEDSLAEKITQDIDTLEDIYEMIDKAIEEEPPVSSKEGGVIKNGYNKEADELRYAKTEGKNWLAELENSEREKTGIKNLKIKYNKVFGYYFEVTNSYAGLVPEEWIRKQTLTNAERYTTEKLKELEDKILNAEEKLFALEYDLFCEIRDTIECKVERIKRTAKAVAKIDAFSALAYVAEKNNYARPVVNNDDIIDIKAGRHPVVERMISNDMFVSNDTFLDEKDSRISIITGPNMAGKSTYMRQTALIVLMAQIGSFVPADSAVVGIADRIFTRVGASDDLASGQSTFMVEMTEVSNILRNATKNSLVILDEIGRGTSTFDGLSIAWAVVEYINGIEKVGVRTLFATHYHELTELEGNLNGVKNYSIAVSEKGDDIVFLRKIVRGGADKSYGIQVARLAGVPKPVLDRAKSIADAISENDLALRARELLSGKEIKHSFSQQNQKAGIKPDIEGQLNLFNIEVENEEYEKLKNRLNEIDISHITPLEALNELNNLKLLISKN